MASLDRELRAIAARGTSATVTPDSLVRSVTSRATRRRATTIAGAGLGALAIVGLAATAAMTLGHHAPPATPPDKVLGTVTLPFDPVSSDNPESPSPLGLACGDPAPTPVTNAGGLEWQPRSDSTTVDPAHFAAIKMTLRNTAGDTLPAAVSQTEYVIVHHGIVAGWTNGTAPEGSRADGTPNYRYLDSGAANITGGQFFGAGWICPENADQEQLAVGDYQVYPVIHVSASPADAARQWLRLAGYRVPTDDPTDLAVLTPGSWDCTDPAGAGATAQEASSKRPLLCAPESLAGVTVNRDARTVTVPYTSRLYERSLDVTLVGEPLPYTVSTLMDASSFLGYPGVAAAPITDASALQCGVRLDEGVVPATGRMSTTVEAAGLDVHARTRFESGTVIGLSLTPHALAPRETIAYPAPMRVWFLAHPTGSPDDALARQEWYVVAGTATATVNRGEPVVLDRFAGPSTASVAFTDVRWCDEGASWATSLVMFEGTERVDDGTGVRESTILDGWNTDIAPGT